MTATTDPALPSHRRPVLAISLVSYLMIVLDISIVITALPKIQHGLDFSTTGLTWVQNAYTLAFGGLLLLGARAGDILGRRRMFIVGLGIFTAASLAIGLVHSAAGRIAARAVQGVGAAILAPSTLALLQTHFAEGPERTRAVALYGSVAGIGASIGMVLGGMMGFWFFMTPFLQRVLGYSPFGAGLAFLPMAIANFAMALAVPKFTHWFGNGRLLAGGLAVTLIGMAWLSRLSADSAYLTAVAVPMFLIGIGQGGTLAPLTASGIAGVAAKDAGAASGLVNVAHQLGSSLGLGVLIVVFAASGSGTLGARELLAHRAATALAGSTAMLAVALILVIALIVRPARSPVTSNPEAGSIASKRSLGRFL